MGNFPLSPEKMLMLLTVEGCWGAAASDAVDLPKETIETWGKRKIIKKKTTVNSSAAEKY